MTSHNPTPDVDSELDFLPEESSPLSLSFEEDEDTLSELAGGEGEYEYDIHFHDEEEFSHIIADDISATNFQLAFDTPLLFGKFDGVPACLLTFIIRPGSTGRARIKKLKLIIHFEDEEKKRRPAMRHPALPDVRKWFPGGDGGLDFYLGKPHYGIQTETRLLSFAIPGQGATTTKAELGKQIVSPSQGRLKITSTLGGDNIPRRSNILRFEILEDKVLREGIPDCIRLPVLLEYDEGRSFRPKICSVSAEMGWGMFRMTKQLIAVNGKARDVIINPAKLTSSGDRRVKICDNDSELEAAFAAAVETSRANLDHFSGRANSPDGK